MQRRNATVRGSFSRGCHNKINVVKGNYETQPFGWGGAVGQEVFLDSVLSSSLTWQNGIVFHLSAKEWDRLLLSTGCGAEFRSG